MRVKSKRYLASFLVGFGSILNVAPAFIISANLNSSTNDKDNLQKDWENVGNYLYSAMNTLKNDRNT